MRTITYNTEWQRSQLLLRWHTVESMRCECKRSRSWAYQMLQRHADRRIELVSAKTGRREMAIPRRLVDSYIATTRRGNPDWQPRA